MDYKKWFAKVKYYNGDIEDISVRKIKTEKGNQFCPKDYKDFNANILYSIKTSMNDIEGKEQRYYGFIGRLAGSVEELNRNSKRISWPAWPLDVLDEPNNTSQDEKQQTIASSSILAHRERAALKKSSRITAQEELYKFLHNNNVEPVNESDFFEELTESRGNAASRDSQNQDTFSINYNTTKNVSVTFRELKNLLNDNMQRMEEKIEKRSKIIEENMSEIVKEAYKNTVSKMEQVLGQFPSSILDNVQFVTEWLNNTRDNSEFHELAQLSLSKQERTYNNFLEKQSISSSAMSSETEKKVNLGSGFYCTQASFTTMKKAKSDCDWCIALLIGVFGDDAKLMRVYPRKSGLKKFPLAFLMLAQNLYRQRLEDAQYKGNIDEMIKSLPAYLSDRALDLGGGRSISSRIKRFKKCKEVYRSKKKQKEASIEVPSTSVEFINSISPTSL